MSQQQYNEIGEDVPRYFEEIKSAIINKQALSFVYEKEDGEIITHNAIYPRQLFRRNDHSYFRAYCHFTNDTRVFRLDRIRSLQVKLKPEPLTRKQKIMIMAGVGFVLLVVFLALLLFF